jgi:hypothetical protein
MCGRRMMIPLSMTSVHADVVILDGIIAGDDTNVLDDMCMKCGLKNTCEF